MAGIFAAIGSVFNVVTSTAEAVEEQVNGWREVGSTSVYKAQIESAVDFLETLGTSIPDTHAEILWKVKLLKEMMKIISSGDTSNKVMRRLAEVKAELLAMEQQA